MLYFVFLLNSTTITGFGNCQIKKKDKISQKKQKTHQIPATSPKFQFQRQGKLLYGCFLAILMVPLIALMIAWRLSGHSSCRCLPVFWGAPSRRGFCLR